MGEQPGASSPPAGSPRGVFDLIVGEGLAGELDVSLRARPSSAYTFQYLRRAWPEQSSTRTKRVDKNARSRSSGRWRRPERKPKTSEELRRASLRSRPTFHSERVQICVTLPWRGLPNGSTLGCTEEESVGVLTNRAE